MMQKTSHYIPQIQPGTSLDSEAHQEAVLFDRLNLRAHETGHVTEVTLSPRESTVHIPKSAEVEAHERYIASLMHGEIEGNEVVTAPRPQFENQPVVAEHVRELTQRALQAGQNIIAARDAEIRRDMHEHHHPAAPALQAKKFSIAEVIFGKTLSHALSSGVKKGVETLAMHNPAAHYRELEIEYMQREAQAGSRALDNPNMKFFFLDPATCVWHIEAGEHEPAQTLLYHIRPENVVKQRVGGPLLQVSGAELDNLAYYIQACYQELGSTVYKQTPAAA